MCSSNVCSGKSRKSKGPETGSSACVVLAQLELETLKKNSPVQSCSIRGCQLSLFGTFSPFSAPLSTFHYLLFLLQCCLLLASLENRFNWWFFFLTAPCHSLMRDGGNKGPCIFCKWIKVTDPHNVDEILAGYSDVNDVARWALGSLTSSCLSKYFRFMHLDCYIV